MEKKSFWDKYKYMSLIQQVAVVIGVLACALIVFAAGYWGIIYRGPSLSYRDMYVEQHKDDPFINRMAKLYLGEDSYNQILGIETEEGQ